LSRLDHWQGVQARETGGLGEHAEHSEPLNHPSRLSTGKTGLTVAQILDEDQGN
jgi:hypothetical protein